MTKHRHTHKENKELYDKGLKYCACCKKILELRKFNKAKNKCGLSSRCIDCGRVSDEKRKRIKHEIVKELFDKGLKNCSKCKKLLRVEMFSKDKSSKYGLNYRCKDCLSVWIPEELDKREKIPEKKRLNQEQVKEYYNKGLKYCPRCNKILQIGMFYKQKNNKSKYGLSGNCIDCTRKPRKYRSRISPRKSKELYDKGLKYCPGCKEILSVNMFWKSKSSTYNLGGRCKACAHNVDELTPEEIERRRIKSNKARIKYINRSEWSRIRHAISSAMSISLKKNGTSKEGKSWEKLVGYEIKRLKKHLEKYFDVGMTWENYGDRGKGWEIDHIKPASMFNFNSPYDPEFKKCWSLRNLRPRWATTEIAQNHGSEQIGNRNKNNHFVG